MVNDIEEAIKHCQKLHDMLNEERLEIRNAIKGDIYIEYIRLLDMDIESIIRLKGSIQNIANML